MCAANSPFDKWNTLAIVRRVFFVYVAMFLCMCHCWTGSDTAGVLRPRGVPLSKKVFYDPSRDFSCLDGSGTFPFYFVNDDYCDCSDGSDEPGTSACPNGIFHCVNTGYLSENIPSSRVNDEICDCCDGSDEYNSTADCIDFCMELGRQAREAEQRQLELFEKGHALWRQYSVQGKHLKESNKRKLEKLKKAEEEAIRIKLEREAAKDEIEEKEKAAIAKYESLKEDKRKKEEELEMLQDQVEERQLAEIAFSELDQNEDGVVSYQEIQQFPHFDSNDDGVVTEEEAKFFLHMKDEMQLEEFITTGWMIMKPIYLSEKLSTPTPPSPPADISTPISTETPTEDTTQEQEEVQYNSEDYYTSDDEVLNEDDEELDTPPEFPPKEVDSESKPDEKKEVPHYDEETQELVDVASEARRQFKDALNKLEKMKDEVKQIQTDVEADFGPDDEFAILKGQCFDFDDREYTYKLCPFDKASQVPKSGGSEITLGRWGLWAGPEGNIYSKMKYESGQICWNGPSRTATVLLQCGIENKILSTSEPNRCEYLMEFSTPSLCSKSLEINRVHEHTEL